MVQIKNLTKAANRIKKAIAEKESIILYGDADLDGVSSVIIAQEAIRSLGGDVTAVYFPDREKEGYGITRKALDVLKAHSPALLIAFDLGISNFEEIPIAKKLGFDVVVVDHHKVIDKLPKADIIVDPKQPGDAYPFKEFAACGLSFRLAEAVIGKDMSESLRKNMVELAALGTVADMMARKQDNIALIEEGLEALFYSWRPGIRAFLESDLFSDMRNRNARVNQMIGILNVRDARSGKPGAYRLLTSPSLPKAKKMLEVFIGKNRIRREQIERVVEEVRMRIFHKKGDPMVFEGGEAFEFMLLGAVASIISQEAGKPTFVFKQGEQEILGSVRAPSGFDTVEAMHSCADFLDTYGGHPQASGFRTSSSKRENLKTCLFEYFTSHQ